MRAYTEFKEFLYEISAVCIVFRSIEFIEEEVEKTLSQFHKQMIINGDTKGMRTGSMAAVIIMPYENKIEKQTFEYAINRGKMCLHDKER